MEEESEQAPEKTSLMSTEAVLMLSLGIILDFLSIICAILSFIGIGLILSKIVYAIGFIFVTIWSIFRGGGIQRGGKGKMGKKMSKGLGKFIGKHWKKLALKALPVIGDVIPLWTITIYTELKRQV